MKKPKRGNSYIYKKIEQFANENDYTITELGNDVVGEGFLVLKHNERDLTISFVLTGATSKAYIYRCVYSDVK